MAGATYHMSNPDPGARNPLLGAVASVSTAIVLVAVAIAAFFNPFWIDFEQQRATVPAITGYTLDQVRTATGSILASLFFGPPDFAVALNGQPVLDAAERSHMVDVRTVLLGFGIVVAVAIVALVLIVAANRRNAWLWRAVARGSGALAVVGVVVGIAVLFFFDAAFEVFHLVFFPQGNFSFDPRTERLTQLFPDQFWTETSIGIAVVGLSLAVLVTLAARWQASHREMANMLRSDS